LRVQDSPDYLVNRVDKEIEGPFGEIFCTEIEKSTKMQTMRKKIQGKKSYKTSRLSRKSRTYTLPLPCPATPSNSHPSWHMEGADVLDTEIL